MRRNGLPLSIVGLLMVPASVPAQDSYKIEALKEAPPAALAGPIREALAGQGYRVVDDQGKTYAEIWLRKDVPAAGQPAGPKGAVLFPFLAEGELLGALRYPDEGHDYRDQSIPMGAYTLRYGLQPVNGDHLGVSPYRDYALLVPASRDKAIGEIAKKKLDEQSSEAAGTSHPAVLMMLASPEPAPATPSLVHDEAKATWGAVLPLNLAVKGGSSGRPFPVQLIVIGAAMN